MNEELYKALAIFRGWLIRDHDFTEDEAWNETTLIDLNVKDFTSRDEFISYSRKGATKKMTRRERIALFFSFENAANHASIEKEIDASDAFDKMFNRDHNVRYTDWNFGL